MDFRILGPLEISDDGVEVTVGGPSTTRLLSLLLLDAGRALSMSRLIDSFWEEEPPATAKRQIQNHAAALRRRLGAERIASVGDGYRFNPDGARLDALEFTEAVKSARKLTNAEQPRQALAALRAGLRLWRGYPLVGMSGSAIDAAAARLDEQRLSAIEDRVDLELATGTTDATVSDLRRVLADHPYRQRAAAQLMLALHRDGRTTEALTVFEATRDRLADELGLDPGKALSDRHTAILRDDPSLVAPSGPTLRRRPAAPDGPIPNQLPTAPAKFVGRAEALATLDKQLNDSHAARLCVVAGAAGTGKTALATHWAHQIHERFPDGQLFINLRGFDPGEPISPIDALGRLLRALQPPGSRQPSDVDEAADLYRSMTNGKRLLVVLDNAANESQVRPLLPAGSGNFTVVTSRSRLAGLTAIDSAAALGLAPLDETEAIALLAEVIDDDRLRADPTSTHRIVQSCDRLPLALRIAAALLADDAGLTPAGLADDLDTASRLDRLTIDGDPYATVSVALDHSLAALSAAEQRLLCLLGLIPGDDFASELAEAVQCDNNTGKLLAHLESMHLVEQQRPDRYRFHDLVREFVKRRAAIILADGERFAMADRFIDWHHGFGRESRPEEDTNILTACQEFRGHPTLWRLALPMAQMAGAGRIHVGLKDAVNRLIVETANHDDDRGQYQAIAAKFGYELATGDRTAAIETAQQAVDVAERLDTSILARATRNLGMAWYASGRLAEAEAPTRRGLELALVSKEWRESFDSRFSLSNICRCLGKYDEVDELLTQMARQLEDKDSLQRSIWLSNGHATLYIARGQFEDALLLIEKSLRLFTTFSEPRWEALARINLGELRRRSGQFSDAESELLAALELAQRIENEVMECDVLCELVLTAVAAGDHPKAKRYAEALTADDLTASIEPADQARIALALSAHHTAVGDHRTGAEQAERAIAMAEVGPHMLELGRAHLALADALNRLDDQDRAHEHRDSALSIFTELGVPEAESARDLFDEPAP